MTTPTNDPNPFGYDGTPAPPGQAPLPGQFGAAGVPGPGYPAVVTEQGVPTQTAPVLGGEQAGSEFAPPGSEYPVGPQAQSQYGPGGTPAQPPQYGQYGQYGPGGVPGQSPMPPFGYGAPPTRPSLTSAVAIVALCLFWVPVVGLVLAVVGMVKTARGKARGRGLAISALVLSILVTAVAGLAAAAIASKPAALDAGCRNGKSAVLDQSKKIDADSKRNDTRAVQADVSTMVDELGKAAAESKRGDVRATVLALRDDYAALAAGNGDRAKLDADLHQMDHLCTIGQ